MTDFISSLLISSPIALAANSAVAFGNWVGACFSGSCGTTPGAVTEMLTGIGSSLGSTVGYLGTAASHLWWGIFAFLPDGGTFPPAFHTAFQYFGNTLASVNFILPVSTLIYCLSFAFSIRITLFAFHLMRVVISFVRGIPVDGYKF